ncbi:hypothetical protein DIPPA_18060 [Diplonema papillatum]|nr:hypothetical protein DIPPA_18060 [Diplonema papillatum]
MSSPDDSGDLEYILQGRTASGHEVEYVVQGTDGAAALQDILHGSDHHPLPAGGRDWEHALHGTEYIVEEVDYVLEEEVEEQDEREEEYALRHLPSQDRVSSEPAGRRATAETSGRRNPAQLPTRGEGGAPSKNSVERRGETLAGLPRPLDPEARDSRNQVSPSEEDEASDLSSRNDERAGWRASKPSSRNDAVKQGYRETSSGKAHAGGPTPGEQTNFPRESVAFDFGETLPQPLGGPPARVQPRAQPRIPGRNAAERDETPTGQTRRRNPDPRDSRNQVSRSEDDEASDRSSRDDESAGWRASKPSSRNDAVKQGYRETSSGRAHAGGPTPGEQTNFPRESVAFDFGETLPQPLGGPPARVQPRAQARIPGRNAAERGEAPPGQTRRRNPDPRDSRNQVSRSEDDEASDRSSRDDERAGWRASKPSSRNDAVKQGSRETSSGKAHADPRDSRNQVSRSEDDEASDGGGGGSLRARESAGWRESAPGSRNNAAKPPGQSRQGHRGTRSSKAPPGSEYDEPPPHEQAAKLPKESVAFDFGESLPRPLGVPPPPRAEARRKVARRCSAGGASAAAVNERLASEGSAGAASPRLTRKQARMLEYERERLRECTFNPRVNPGGAGRRSHGNRLDALASRRALVQKDLLHRRGVEEKLAREMEQCTFVPQISHATRAFADAKRAQVADEAEFTEFYYRRPSVAPSVSHEPSISSPQRDRHVSLVPACHASFQSRLDDYKKDRDRLQSELAHKHADAELTFAPQVLPPRQSRHAGRAKESRHVDPMSTEDIAAQELAPAPKILEKSKRIAAACPEFKGHLAFAERQTFYTRRRQASLDRIQRAAVAAEAPATSVKPQREIDEAIDGLLRRQRVAERKLDEERRKEERALFRPTIHSVHAQSSNLLVTGGPRRRAADPRLGTEYRELRECRATPAINPQSAILCQKSRDARDSTLSGPYGKKVETSIVTNHLRREQAAEETRECTFRPKLSHGRSSDLSRSDVDVKGFSSFLERQEKAQAKKHEKKQAQAALGSVSPAASGGAMGRLQGRICTVAEPFNLSSGIGRAAQVSRRNQNESLLEKLQVREKHQPISRVLKYLHQQGEEDGHDDDSLFWSD